MEEAFSAYESEKIAEEIRESSDDEDDEEDVEVQYVMSSVTDPYQTMQYTTETIVMPDGTQ